jgi:hypothetical protein
MVVLGSIWFVIVTKVLGLVQFRALVRDVANPKQHPHVSNKSSSLDKPMVILGSIWFVIDTKVLGLVQFRALVRDVVTDVYNIHMLVTRVLL